MKLIIFFLLTLISSGLLAQVSPNKYCIELTDKNNNDYNINSPEEFLSERALQRRERQNIEIDFTDLPVSNFYIDSLRNLGLEILNVSKWFNYVTVYTTDTDLIDTISNISFVKSTLKSSIAKKEETEVTRRYFLWMDSSERTMVNSTENYYDYGLSTDQIYINNGQFLHNEGYRGAGMLIAVTDAGFRGLPNLPSFDSLYSQGRVLATRNFVDGGDFVYNYGTHGMNVLSILAGNAPGYLIGSAPEASYLLLMSEDPASETYIEELNWISAAEFADSLGADVINVSLGYVKFDTPGFDHNYSDLDGRTAIISKAATMASRKGIIVVPAAGNNGSSMTHPWISAPADADSILTVGAVWANKIYAAFSSRGPAFDGRIKPDVVAMGGETVFQSLDGLYNAGNGTSFAAPLISGFVACLWQKFPDKSNMEIIDAVKRSSNFYNSPTDTLGYGIPNFEIASEILQQLSISNPDLKNDNFTIFPNPFKNDFEIKLDVNAGDTVKITITDSLGKIIYADNNKIISDPDNNKFIISALNEAKQGIYIITITINSTEYSAKVIKE